MLALRNSPALSDDQILRILVESGMERLLAARRIGFLMAYCRLILELLARTLGTLQQVLPDGAQRWNAACQERLTDVGCTQR